MSPSFLTGSSRTIVVMPGNMGIIFAGDTQYSPCESGEPRGHVGSWSAVWSPRESAE